tara:strand:+ start:2012 stop:3835 length:1824 start_codon:yes stop_codon:yes gene_type:complete
MGFWSETFGGGNSFTESVANTFTPNDGYSYERGELVNDSTGRVMTQAEKTAAGVGSADNQKTNRKKYESSPRRSQAKLNPDGSSTDRPITGIQSLLPMLGGMVLGPVGVAAGLTYNRYNVPQSGGQSDNNPVPASASNKASPDAALLNYADRYNVPSITKEELRKARESGNRIQGSFYKDGDTSKQFKMNMFGNSYEINPNTGNSKLIEDQAAAAGGEGGIAAVRPVGTQATAPTSTMPAISAESEFAKQQIISPPAEWLIANGYPDTNPSYEAIRRYNTDRRAGVLTMSEGGRLGPTQMQMGQMARKGGISGQMGGLQQYGAYLDNRYGDPEFDRKRMQFLREVNQQEQQTFGGGSGGSFPSSGLGGKGGAGSSADRLTQPLNELTAATDNTQLIENGFNNNIDPVAQYAQSANASSAASLQAPTNSLYKGLSPVFGGAIGGARAALGMAEGGDVEFALGGNEKDLINAMENVVRKDLAYDGEFNPANISDEDKIVIAQFVQQYGVDAIPRLVKKIQDGSIDETRERFARGENGVVRGNGDGSGVDDMVTAQLKDGDATQDVLLADGEFVLRKDAYEALKDAGVNVDKVNDAGSNAAKELNKMMTA